MEDSNQPSSAPPQTPSSTPLPPVAAPGPDISMPDNVVPKNKKGNLMKIGLVLFLVLAIPVGLVLVKNTIDSRSHASEMPQPLTTIVPQVTLTLPPQISPTLPYQITPTHPPQITMTPPPNISPTIPPHITPTAPITTPVPTGHLVSPTPPKK
jgi:hypothetical protein